jgi:hypothetical protein
MDDVQSRETRGRLIRATVPVMIVYAVLGGAGLYLLITDRILPGIGLLLAAHAVAWAFHLWARRVSPDGKGKPEPGAD